MVGIVTFDDAMDVMVEEATEDITRWRPLIPARSRILPPPYWPMPKAEFHGCLCSCLHQLLQERLSQKYENAFAAIPLLVSFIPMLMDTGGNCGSQSATLIIRGLALDEIHFRDLFRVIFKEFRVSVICGSVLAVTNGIRILITYQDPRLALVYCAVSDCYGHYFQADRLHASSVRGKMPPGPGADGISLITTLVDTFSILIYFSIATELFQL